jgi:hypothetical protein
MTTLIRYSLLCSDCGGTVYTDFIEEESGLPTVCPKNESHTNLSDIAILKKHDLSIQGVKEIEVDGLDPDNASTKIKGLNFDAVGGDWTNKDFSFTYPVDLLMAEGHGGFVEDGDIIEFVVAPDTIIGVVYASANLGDEWVTVNPTVLANLKAGHFVRFGNANDDEHLVTVVDIANSRIGISPGLTENKTAGENVLRSVKYVEDVELQPNEYINLGGQTFGAVAIPANTILRVRYYAVSAKRIRGKLIFKY